jgi:hypothetical protein
MGFTELDRQGNPAIIPWHGDYEPHKKRETELVPLEPR